MKITDYSRIAKLYDDNPIRHNIPVDPYIGDSLKSNPGGISVLDLACGTGNYLVKQIDAYRGENIRWFGIDKSPDMLAAARKKELDATLLEGDAADLPLDDASIDYIKIRFAFHHFENKRKAIAEIQRVLRKAGAVSLFNLSQDYMKYSWVYRYFPESEAYDRERFPPTKDLFSWFEDAGFNTELSVRTLIRKFSYKDIIAEVENRDMSQLNLISDEAYQAGLSEIRRDATRREYLIGDISFVDLFAVTSGARG